MVAVARGRMTDRLLCRECGVSVRVPEARFVGPAILCAACHGQLALCWERNCGGRLMEITAGPAAGDWQCQVCGPNVIQFPDPGVQSGP